MTIQRRAFLSAVAITPAVLAGCVGRGSVPDDEAGITGETLTLTTTTSTYDTGLLDELNAPFEVRFGVTVDTVALGTGAALANARNGDADVVMVHARPLEDDFLREGYGVNRRTLMFNDFVIVGPSDDPAGIAGSDSATEAFDHLSDTDSTFVSRGDNSGTHSKERSIWQAAELEPAGDWYREVGQGMGEVLVQADLSGAYTLTDRGTYLSMRGEIDLVIHVQGPIEGGPELLANPYGIAVVNPAVHNHVNYDLAMAYVGFVTGQEGQRLIEEYSAHGEQLFYPRSLSTDPQFQQYVPEGWTPEGEEE